MTGFEVVWNGGPLLPPRPESPWARFEQVGSGGRAKKPELDPIPPDPALCACGCGARMERRGLLGRRIYLNPFHRQRAAVKREAKRRSKRRFMR